MKYIFGANIKNLVLFIFLMTAYLALHAMVPLQFEKDSSAVYIGKHVSLFQDATKQLNITDIIDHTNLFNESKDDVPNLGIGDVNNWIRFELKNLTDEEKLVVNLSHANIDEVVFYSLKNGVIDSTRIESGTALNKRDYPHQFYLFEIPIKKGEDVICYFKLRSNTQLLVPISIHTEKGLLEILLDTDIFSALFIGLMMSMIFYNIFLYFSTGEKHYIIYVNYIFWVTIAQCAVLGILEPIFSIHNRWVLNRLLTFSGAMSGIGAIYFVKSFLQTAKDAPKLNKLLNIFLIGYFIAIGFLCFGYLIPAYKLVNVVAGGGSIIVLILAFKLSREKYEQTKYFLIAWCVFLVSVVVYVFKDYNLLPYNFFTVRAVQIGAVFEAILLSFALGDKINIYRKEKDESQARELSISLENQLLIREQNVILEDKVEERTRALTASNESLQATLTHLKETQSQLVEAEKMASLGQLTAGVAHEINNPINFVTSNVAPLKRDIKMIWETLEEVEQVALDDNLSSDEKRLRIENFKDEIDLDYLKTEVEFLLKGMSDGANRTAEIVKSLRIFSRVDEDTLKFADINEGLESTMVILNSLVQDGIVVQKKYGALPKIECYAGKLNQVFLNIITNAIYALHDKVKTRDGAKLTLETGVCENASAIYVIIRDNGIGIPDHIRDRIFEPFFTTKDVGEGTGLGMSIAYNTIIKHNGKIEIESVEGEGTSFILIIPIRQNI